MNALLLAAIIISIISSVSVLIAIFSIRRSEALRTSESQKLFELVSSIPQRVIMSAQSVSNTYKGKLGELIGYIKLKVVYDRLFTVGNVVDFIGIKFPDKDGNGGSVDFIDVKTGTSPKLSKEQVLVKRLIENKKVSFIKFRIKEE